MPQKAGASSIHSSFSFWKSLSVWKRIFFGNVGWQSFSSWKHDELRLFGNLFESKIF